LAQFPHTAIVHQRRVPLFDRSQEVLDVALVHPEAREEGAAHRGARLRFGELGLREARNRPVDDRGVVEGDHQVERRVALARYNLSR
jgi:hypothetical protein